MFCPCLTFSFSLCILLFFLIILYFPNQIPLAKLAMDIVAKHIPADKDGVRIAELDERSYRYLLWNHRPLTDFWMTGPGTVK